MRQLTLWELAVFGLHLERSSPAPGSRVERSAGPPESGSSRCGGAGSRRGRPASRGGGGAAQQQRAASEERDDGTSTAPSPPPFRLPAPARGGAAEAAGLSWGGSGVASAPSPQQQPAPARLPSRRGAASGRPPLPAPDRKRKRLESLPDGEASCG
jgi:hypothetical protein